MRYPYRCSNCAQDWDVYKSVAMIDAPEFCPQCGTQGERYIATTHFYGAADWNDAQYRRFNPALGAVVMDRNHKRELCRRKNVEEIGNDFGSGERMQEHFDRTREAELSSRWDDI